MKIREYHFRMLIEFIFHPFPIHYYAVKLSRLLPKGSNSQSMLRIKKYTQISNPLTIEIHLL